MFTPPTTEQSDFKDVVGAFATARSPSEEVRRLSETPDGYDPAVWAEMASQLRLQSLNIPERYGGSGFGPLETAIVFEELGRTLMCTPYLATVGLASNLLMSVGDDEACGELLPGIAAGQTIATVAISGDDGRVELDSISMGADDGADGPLLTGAKSFVIDGALADLILVVVRTSGGASVYAVRGDAPGLDRQRSTVLDETRKLARLVFDGVPGRLIGVCGKAWPAVSRALDHTIACLAAEQVGGIQAVLDMSVAYAKEREQFGRPIGSFQAIKHKCADMLVALESARSAAAHAAWAAAEAHDQLAGAAALAKAYCSEAYVEAAKQTIQIHGGIGFTWEHDAHLYLRRAKSSELLFGSPAHHREQLARAVGV